MTDLDSRMTQTAFGGLVGITQQAVSDFVTRGILRDGDTARGWLLSYTEHLREVAAGRDPSGELSYERARVARESADKLALSNAVARREFAPVQVLEVVLADVARQVATHLDALVPTIKRRLPDMPAAALAQITEAVHTCRELCAGANIASAEERSALDDDDELVEPDLLDAAG